MGLTIDVRCQNRSYMDEKSMLGDCFPIVERKLASQSENSSSGGEQRALLLLDTELHVSKPPLWTATSTWPSVQADILPF